MNKNINEIEDKNLSCDLKLNETINDLKISHNYFQRNYGIDFLRIFCMINIINLHTNGGTKLIHIDKNSKKYKIIWKLETLSYFPVDCFGMISGIVGYKRYKFSNLIHLWMISLFYSISSSIYKYFFNHSIKNLIFSFCPILIRYRWYMNAYFGMYLFLPFINQGIKNLNRKFYRNIVFFLIFFFSVYSIVNQKFEFNDYNFLLNGFSSLWLIILYIIGGYFGKYIIFQRKYSFFDFLFYITLYLGVSFLSSEFYFKYLNTKYNQILINYLSPTILLQAISLIMLFSHINIKNKIAIRFIAFFAPLTFGVMFIHSLLINVLSKWIKNFTTEYLFFKIYGLSILLYFLSAIIDFFRFQLFKCFRIKKFCLFLEDKIPILLEKLLKK